MNSLLIIISSIIFYFIGRHSTKPKEADFKAIKKLIRKPKAGVLPFKKPEDFTPEGIEDKKLEESWIKSGLAEEVMK